MKWAIEYTDQFGDWFVALDGDTQNTIDVTVQTLAERGSGLGRPLVDTLKGSRHANMKELRPPVGNIRILFAFDPRRQAILLLGGDKSFRWNDWYKEVIPLADALYDDHLDELKREGEW